MSSNVYNDYEALYIFIDALKGYLNTLDQANSSLDSAFGVLGDSWKDSKRGEFEEVYSQLRDCMNRFEESSKDQIPHLQQMAQLLEEYHRLHTSM